MSSILDALKKVEKAGEEPEQGPFDWPHPLDARESLGRSVNVKRGGRFLFFMLTILFFFSTTVLLLVFILARSPKADRAEEKRARFTAAAVKEEEETARQIVVEKTEEGVRAFVAVGKKDDVKLKKDSEPEKKREAEIEVTDDASLKKADAVLFNLHGISWSSEPSKRMAVINSTIAREGRLVDGVRVVRINKKGVVVEKNGEQMLLSFDKY